MQNNRNDRLAADYRDMLKIQDRPYLSWTATKGEPPYAEEYLLTVKLRTYALSTENGRYIVGATDLCLIKISLWDSYPHVAPYIKMLSIPPVFHPDWYSKGTYCPPEPWREETPLKEYVLRMLEALKYDKLTESAAPANYKAQDWYIKNRDNSGFFPSDSTELTENSDEETAAAEKAASHFTEVIDSF